MGDMSAICPQCQTPIEVGITRSAIWVQWRCEICSSLLGFSFRNRILNCILYTTLVWAVNYLLSPSGPWLRTIFGLAGAIGGCVIASIFFFPIGKRDILLLERNGQHCETCGYNLVKNTSGQCPECGRCTPVAQVVSPAWHSDQVAP